jgi:hypothetical protein
LEEGIFFAIDMRKIEQIIAQHSTEDDMGQRNYNLSLDENVTERVVEHLKMSGQTLSGFVRILLAEYDAELASQPLKPIEDMTLKELGLTFARWLKLAKGE